MKTTIVLADDHDFVRYAVSAYVAHHGGFEVLAAVGDAQTAVAACAHHQPQVLVLDVDMPGRDPLSAIADVRAAAPRTRVVTLVHSCSDTLVAQIVRARAHGCLLKSEPLQSLFAALRRVAEGKNAYSSEILCMLPGCGESGHAEKEKSRFNALTPRELEVLRYIGRGYNNDQMAGTMSLSKRTVERHVARLMDSLSIRERASLQRFALEHGVAC